MKDEIIIDGVKYKAEKKEYPKTFHGVCYDFIAKDSEHLVISEDGRHLVNIDCSLTELKKALAYMEEK